MATTPAAGADLAALLRDWTTGTTSARLALDPRLLAYERRHPDDGALALVRVLRAHNELERGNQDRAIELASPAALGPPGTARDLAILALGAAERRAGRYDEALARLAPLSDKLIDPWASSLLGEELTRAALAGRQWQQAVRYMDRWLRQSERGGRAATLKRVEQLVSEVEPGELLRAFDELRAAQPASLDEDISALVVARLAALANERRDSGLARSLLDRFRPLLGDQGEGIARLAASTGRATVTVGTLGLVLELDRPELRDRTADVTAGVTFGLGLPGSAARLVTRVASSSADGLAEAMQGLAADGAAVVIAGIDPGRAARAVELSREAELPLLLLSHEPGLDPSSSPFTFMLGGDPAEHVATLVDALRSAGRRRVAVVGPRDRAELPALGAESMVTTLPCGPELDLGPLRNAGVDALVLVDGARCGRQAAAAARELRAAVGFGLGVAGLVANDLETNWHLAAGLFPIDPSRAPAALEGWLASRAQPPSWWTALGRDAAVLGWAAVRDLAGVDGDEPAQVAARRRTAAAELGRARASLWTSAQSGFGEDRVLSRQVVVVEPSQEVRRGRR